MERGRSNCWFASDSSLYRQCGELSGREANWQSLDQSDTDLGGCSAILIDVPGANPSQLVLALGKDGNAYLVNRNNLEVSLDNVARCRWQLRGQLSLLPTQPAREHILCFALVARSRCTRLLRQIRQRSFPPGT